MFGHLFQRIKRWRSEKLIRPKDYYTTLQRYRRENPESLEDEKRQIQEWIAQVNARRYAELQGNREIRASSKEMELADALYQMREVARAAFMSHPAATEWDFRRCWPSIREEMLKQHALEELAANPALSENLAKEASESNAHALHPFHGTNFQLLRKDDTPN